MRQWVKDEKLADQVPDACLVEIVRLARAHSVEEQTKRQAQNERAEAKRKAEDERAEAAHHRLEEDRRRREEEDRQDKISQACGGAEKVITEYLAATTPDERIKFCYLGSLTQRQFHRYYAVAKSPLHKFRTFRVTKLTPIDRRTYQVDAIADDGIVISQAFYLGFTVDRLLIDWPRSHGLNDLTIEEFRAKREQQPRGFWVNAGLTEYYNYEFEDSLVYQSTTVGEVTPDGVYLYTEYIRRSDPTCKAFIEYLSGGIQPMTVLLAPDSELHRVFLILAWSPGRADREGITQPR